jgi:CRISPR type I-D-associated protein Csc2
MSLKKLESYLVGQPSPLIGAETIQLILLREVLDYTVLRTEDTRELNSVDTPLSEKKRETVVKRVAFLGSKQKAAESRQLEHILRSATAKADKKVPHGRGGDGCYLKDNLCLACPRCALFGATALSQEANIKHRIEYSTAFSLLPFDQISQDITFNAVNEVDQRTGQALGTRSVVKPASLFASIVTLRGVTEFEVILTIKTLLACKSYGAESRIGGDCRNTFFGIVAGWEEIITPLELTLELYDQAIGPGPIKAKGTLDANALRTSLNDKYKKWAAMPDRVQMLDQQEVDALVNECSERALDRSFLDNAYSDVERYRKAQR